MYVSRSLTLCAISQEEEQPVCLQDRGGWQRPKRKGMALNMEKKLEIRLLVIGKTGNGKSALCNSILGRDVFKTGRSMSPTTQTAQEGYVVDTPDVTNLEMPGSQMHKEVARWKSMMEPYPSAVLLVVRCDDRNIEEELRTVCKELKNVLNDASGRYVVFDNTRNNDMAVQKLLKMVQEIKEGLTPTVKLILAAMILSGLAFTACVVSEDTKGQVTEGQGQPDGDCVHEDCRRTYTNKKVVDSKLKAQEAEKSPKKQPYLRKRSLPGVTNDNQPTCLFCGVGKRHIGSDNAKVVGMKILQTIAEKKLADISLKKSDQAVILAVKTAVTVREESVVIDPNLLFQRLVGHDIPLDDNTLLFESKDTFLSNPNNKQRFIDKLSKALMENGFHTAHASGDADCLIVQTSPKRARESQVVLTGEDTDLLVLLLHHVTPQHRDTFMMS
ncbi:hypothetical protein BaRGS_00021093 [Batillaria attramentaria]|uniref:AIG1-type G domain-containing protein n=1 Tax=Batillaria attramentaria TaxID=370345 RepID=A0ABD0KKQ2_9CAEN